MLPITYLRDFSRVLSYQYDEIGPWLDDYDKDIANFNDAEKQQIQELLDKHPHALAYGRACNAIKRALAESKPFIQKSYLNTAIELLIASWIPDPTADPESLNNHIDSKLQELATHFPSLSFVKIYHARIILLLKMKKTLANIAYFRKASTEYADKAINAGLGVAYFLRLDLTFQASLTFTKLLDLLWSAPRYEPQAVVDAFSHAICAHTPPQLEEFADWFPRFLPSMDEAPEQLAEVVIQIGTYIEYLAENNAIKQLWPANEAALKSLIATGHFDGCKRILIQAYAHVTRNENNSVLGFLDLLAVENNDEATLTLLLVNFERFMEKHGNKITLSQTQQIEALLEQHKDNPIFFKATIIYYLQNTMYLHYGAVSIINKLYAQGSLKHQFTLDVAQQRKILGFIAQNAVVLSTDESEVMEKVESIIKALIRQGCTEADDMLAWCYFIYLKKHSQSLLPVNSTYAALENLAKKNLIAATFIANALNSLYQPSHVLISAAGSSYYEQGSNYILPFITNDAYQYDEGLQYALHRLFLMGAATDSYWHSSMTRLYQETKNLNLNSHQLIMPLYVYFLLSFLASDATIDTFLTVLDRAITEQPPSSFLLQKHLAELILLCAKYYYNPGQIKLRYLIPFIEKAFGYLRAIAEPSDEITLLLRQLMLKHEQLTHTSRLVVQSSSSQNDLPESTAEELSSSNLPEPTEEELADCEKFRLFEQRYQEACAEKNRREAYAEAALTTSVTNDMESAEFIAVRSDETESKSPVTIMTQRKDTSGMLGIGLAAASSSSADGVIPSPAAGKFALSS